MTNYLINKRTVNVIKEGSIDIQKKLPAAIYTLHFSPTQGLYLEREDKFELPEKIYGDAKKTVKRIIKTFKAREKNTGVLLEGVKGSGKTVTAKYLANELIKIDIPTILVSSAFPQELFSKFVQDIDESVMFLFDEFEKTFKMDRGQDEEDEQEGLLTLLDGVTSSKMLYVLTVNEMYKVNSYLKNRPGRIYYHITYEGLEESEIKEYCKDNLLNKKYLDEIITISDFFSDFTYDMLSALVQEINIHDVNPSDAISFLNIHADSRDNEMLYSVSLFKSDGKEVQLSEGSKTKECNPTGRVSMDLQSKTNKSCVSTYLYPNSITGYDKKKGIFTYKYKDYTIKLTKQTDTTYNYDKLFRM